MKVLVALEYHFLRSPDGKIFADGNYGYAFWERYLAVFDAVLIVARATSVRAIHADWMPVEGPNVALCSLPDFRGPFQYLRVKREAERVAKRAVGEADRFILRIPGTVAGLIEKNLRAQGHHFAVEVVGDPWDALGPGTLKNILRPVARRLLTHQTRRQCRDSFAASYVTAAALQRRYPPGEKAFTIAYSSVMLPKEAISNVTRDFAQAGDDSVDGEISARRKKLWRLIIVGGLSHYHKALDVLLAAMRQCLDRGIDLHLTVLGDGQYRSDFERQTRELGLNNRVDFLGQVPGGATVWAQLRRHDLFVLPSRQEGLPRAMVEAMAAALPCIGSTVGGIPELLPPEDLVAPGDVVALGNKIEEVLGDPNRMTRMSQRNLRVATTYGEEDLNRRRTMFYRIVRNHITPDAS